MHKSERVDLGGMESECVWDALYEIPKKINKNTMLEKVVVLLLT